MAVYPSSGPQFSKDILVIETNTFHSCCGLIVSYSAEAQACAFETPGPCLAALFWGLLQVKLMWRKWVASDVGLLG